MQFRVSKAEKLEMALKVKDKIIDDLNAAEVNSKSRIKALEEDILDLRQDLSAAEKSNGRILDELRYWETYVHSKADIERNMISLMKEFEVDDALSDVSLDETAANVENYS